MARQVKGELSLTYFIYEEHLTPKGLLPREAAKEASAAWHFTKLAIQALEKVTEQASYEGDKDQTIRLRNIAESVATLYGVDLETMMRFMPWVKREAFRGGLYWNTRLDAWVASGGKSYDEVTREPEALNKNG